MTLSFKNTFGSLRLSGSPSRITRAFWCVVLLLMPGLLVASPKQDKIQQAVDAIKAAHHNEDDDYVTDGQRTVWVKSYKKWVPEDLVVMKKESPVALKFLKQAVQHNRLDVLEQLLPDYYRTHGGVQAFAADIKNAQQ